MVEGLRPADEFNHRLEYGNMFHLCEETLQRGNDPTRGNRKATAAPLWEEALKTYARDLCRKHPIQQEQIDHWYNVCRVQFPAYVAWWTRHAREGGRALKRTPLLQEERFDVPYQLPSGRTVRLRGKWDGVELVTERKTSGIFLVEHKTKGDIDEAVISRQLTFDLQTMTYIVALETEAIINLPGTVLPENVPIRGVLYNVVRRPLSGGKGTIVRHKATDGAKCPKCKGTGLGSVDVKSGDRSGECPKCQGAGRVGAKPEETKEAYHQRVREVIEADPAYFFMRWPVAVTPEDVRRFRRQCLDPVLENMLDDWEWWSTPACMEPGRGAEVVYDYCRRQSVHPKHASRHFRFPYGAGDWLKEGGFGDVDAYLDTGSDGGLQVADVLFPELE